MSELAAPPAASGAPGPVPGTERITAIDTLRGVAVLGILVMNIYGFAMPFMGYNNPLMYGGVEWYNLGTWFATHIVFDQKFMTIFSMLFGGGLVIMWERATARGAPFGRIYYRRQFWLLLIGALHAYLIWFGDILFHYALMGMFVYLFRKLQPKTLIIIACFMLPVAPLLSFGSSVYIAKLGVQVEEVEAQIEAGETPTEEQLAAKQEWDEMAPFISPGQEELEKDLSVYRSDYGSILEFRAPMVVMMQTQATLFFILWRVGGLMLLGMALMKLGVLSGKHDAAFYRRMLVIGYGLGLPVMLFSAYSLSAHQWDGQYQFRIGMVPNYIGSILVAMGHIAAVMLIVKRGLFSALMARCTAVGRMALSNYLMHSIVLTTIFYGYGLGLYGTIPRIWQMAFVAGLLGFQLWLSPIWLDRFRFGPVEWLWRSLTYWRRQPMRRQAA